MKEQRRRVRVVVVLARPGCVGACTKGLSVAAAALRRRFHYRSAPCALEREGEGPTDLCDGAAGAPCRHVRACVYVPRHQPAPWMCVCVCVCAARGQLLLRSAFILALSVTLLQRDAELLKLRRDVNVVVPFRREETNLSPKVAALPAGLYSGMTQK